jgi:hypothetical protein
MVSIIERIPKLNIRPKHLIKIYAGNLSQPFDLDSLNATDIISKITTDEKGNPVSPIGGVQSVKITSERDLYVWRELNYETLGKIMEVYPSLGEFSVEVSKVAFFEEHLLDAFKAVESDVFNNDVTANAVVSSFNIYNQIKPLHIIVELLGNEESNNDPQTNKVLIYDCWFDKSEIEFDATEDNLMIVQSATLTAAGLITV